VVLTGEYGGKAGFDHVFDGLALEVEDSEKELAFQLVQLCNAMTGRPLTNDELALIANYPHQLSLLFPGLLAAAA
jgi:homocitrate synthase NifV